MGLNEVRRPAHQEEQTKEASVSANELVAPKCHFSELANFSELCVIRILNPNLNITRIPLIICFNSIFELPYTRDGRSTGFALILQPFKCNIVRLVKKNS